MFQFESQTKDNHSRVRFQPKLKIGKQGDKYEQEADAVADQVMRISESKTIQMQPEEEEEVKMQPKLRMQPQDEEEIVKANSSSDIKFATPETHQQINSAKGNGQPLSPKFNNFMGNAFESDFADVNIHTGSDAVQMNRQLGARAFTYGNDIYFNEGEYNPESLGGKRLLAHELTHVVQQGGNIPVNFIQRDYAVEPVNIDAVGRQLSEEETTAAIEYNSRKLRDENEIGNLRDVLGVSPEPAIIDTDLIEAIVQFQAENNLEQDGKIGVFTARLLGREMLAESDLDSSQRSPGIRMLERGIRLYFTGNSYIDGANTSQKLIRFNVDIPPGLNLRDYALVQFLRGQLLFVPGPANPNVRMYGSLVAFNFANWQVDSVDADPIYWSDATNRWNYDISGRRFSATDDVGRDTHIFNPGDSANVNFRIGVYRVRDLPAATTGNIGSAQPIQSGTWSFSVVRDAAGNFTHP